MPIKTEDIVQINERKILQKDLKLLLCFEVLAWSEFDNLVQ